MRLAVICPLCGMWVHPNRFNVLRWPLKLFRRVMGGREPHSKRGIIRFQALPVPESMKQQLVWRLEEMADALGYELKEKTYHQDREFVVEPDIAAPVRAVEEIIYAPIRYNETGYGGRRE